MISIIGMPTDINSSFLKGAAKAPPIIMNAFYSDATNKFSESGVDLGKENLWVDQGNLELSNQTDDFQKIMEAVTKELKYNNRCISLGGDHSITWPIVEAYYKYFSKINIVHFDAHPDLYENFENNTFSHASPFARILENHFTNDLIQIGIRTLNDHQKYQAERYNVKIIHMKDFSNEIKLDFKGPVYISIDLDGLDPAFAPGVSHPEPGGLSTRDIIKVISNIKGNIVGADIVEYNPEKDLNNITAITAAKLLKELMGKILE
ncbi:MAG: agmatinase [Candidatus Marinimicrobia bacterium]|nr:agmatinase [Candidatus Neomarinimicrobiota bacterium]|tara:strand:- start:89 stop:877 length:789 start_codon:yes stop_codon:yes gene_type:complete